MKTFWCRLYVDLNVEWPFIEQWTTGETMDGKKIICLAIRGISEEAVFEFLKKNLSSPGVGRCFGTIDFIIEKPWKTYGDFAGKDSRFRLAEKFLKDEIDSIEICEKRIRDWLP